MRISIKLHRTNGISSIHWFDTMSKTATDFIEEGLEYERDREFYNATSSYEKALELDPNNLTALELCGELHSYQNHPDDAMRCFEKILTIDPKNRIALEYRRFFGEKC